MNRKNVWTTYGPEERKRVEDLCHAYCHFLDCSKTERECCAAAVQLAKSRGYMDLHELRRQNMMLKAGDKVYATHMDKSVALFQIGEAPLEEGMNILGAHVDAPRIDVKQVPLFEEEGNAYLDTHYYGGIKKYQWLATPLALHGIVVRKDGTKVEIRIGEKEKDPVFVITDLLPHLGKDLNEKTVREFIDAEKMDLLIGNVPRNEKKDGASEGEGKELVKRSILHLLKEQYQIEEEDFLSAELEIVPAGHARDCGLDCSMILAYGQDDRSCAFLSLLALLEMKKPKRTSCCLLVDKEEIGSVGATGMSSKFFENTVAEMMALSGKDSNLLVRRALMNSQMLSCDVSAAYDPMYASYFEKKNAAYLANGLVFNKYSGSGGKSGGNDANPEYMAKLRRIMDQHHVVIQTAELGAVDKGGGGTIAWLMAEYGMEVIDCGVPVLCMHAPWEVTSKADLYEALKGYRAFLKEA